jgi:hypothetical protein
VTRQASDDTLVEERRRWWLHELPQGAPAHDDGGGLRGLDTSGVAKNRGGERRGDLPEQTMGQWQGQTRGKAGLLIVVYVREKWGRHGCQRSVQQRRLRCGGCTRCIRGRGCQQATVAWLGRGAELLVLVRCPGEMPCRGGHMVECAC